MKTKKKKPLAFAVDSAPVIEEEKLEKEPMQTESTNGNKPTRLNLSFDLDENGLPDFSRMHDRTKSKAKEFFNDPKMRDAFGVRQEQAPLNAEVQIFHPAMISGLYDMLGSIEAMAAERWGKIPGPVAKQVFTYTSAEKEALSGPTIRVLNKYVADWMIRYQDEIALATLLVSLTVAKVNAAIMLARTSQVKREPEPQNMAGEPPVSTPVQ